MTETLHRLMRNEADALDIPEPRLDAIRLAGTRMRRRRRIVPALGAAAAVVLIAGGTLTYGAVRGAGHLDVEFHQVREAGLSAAQARQALSALERGGAFAAGGNVYFGAGGRYAVPVGDPAVRGLYYTSAGVIVRHGEDYSMDSDNSRYSVVDTDGSVDALDLSLGDVAPSTDPTQPYFAFARKASGLGAWDVVLIDVRDGSEAARVRVDGAFTWGGWDAPPVALVGDHVYVGLDDHMVSVDWHTGETTTTPLPGSTFPDVNADRYLSVHEDTSADGMNLDASVRVQDARTGETLLDLPHVGDRFASLSPDGTHVLVLPYLLVEEGGQIDRTSGAVIYTVATGDPMKVPASPRGGYGWTPDGSVFSVDADSTTVCDPVAGQCTTSPLDLDEDAAGTLRLGGFVTES